MGTTYNPILESKEFKSGIFAKGPIAEEGTVVFLSEQERTTPLFKIDTSYNPEMREIRNKHCGWQTIVDMSSHVVDVEIEAKAKDHISKFIVNLKADIRVIDPLVIYREWIVDAVDYVKQDLEGIVEEKASGLDIQEDRMLKEMLSEQLKRCLQLNGVEIIVKNITVDYDTETSAHLKELLNTERQKELFVRKQIAAEEIGKGMDGDVGALMDILEGKRPASDIVDVRRKLKKDKIDDAIEEITKNVELLNQLMGNGILSELDGQKAMKNLLPKLGIVNQGRLEEQELEEYAPVDEEEIP